MDYPLENIHKKAFKAHEAANCAGDQGKFWEMHDIMFENQRTLTIENLKKYAREDDSLESAARPDRAAREPCGSS